MSIMSTLFSVMGMLNLVVGVYHLIMAGWIVDDFEPMTLHLLRAIVALILARLMERAAERMK